MKKITTVILCFLLIAGFMTACRGNVTTDSTASTPATTPSTVAPTNGTTQPSTSPTTPGTSTAPTQDGMLEDGMIDGNGDAGSKGNRTNRVS